MPRTTFAAVAVALTLPGPPAMSQPAEIFSVLDRDDNQAVDQAEFAVLGREIFARWDVDRDSNIDEDEFYAGVHDLWDVDDDEVLTLAEYDDGWSDWFAAFYYVTFTELDVDVDDLIAVEEFRTGLDDTRLYDRWTYDAALEMVEFVTALYSVYDVDSDGVLSREEFGDIGFPRS